MRTTSKSATAAVALLAMVCVTQAHTAFAQEAGYPRIVGSSQDGEIDYGPGLHGNIVGGGVARVVGSGENMEIAYEGPTQSQEPMFAHAFGGGENTQIVYSRSADRETALAEVSVLPGLGSSSVPFVASIPVAVGSEHGKTVVEYHQSAAAPATTLAAAAQGEPRLDSPS
jgi:hypothetical protein